MERTAAAITTTISTPLIVEMITHMTTGGKRIVLTAQLLQ
jgi:hypothetical protein